MSVAAIIGKKLGMTQVFTDDGLRIPVTVIEAGPCRVTGVRDPDRDGYAAVQIAFGAIDPRKVNKPMSGHFEKAGVTPRRHLVELRTADAGDYELGQEITRLGMRLLGRRALGNEGHDTEEARFVHDYLWAFQNTIAAGTSQIQRNVIAERILGMPKGR